MLLPLVPLSPAPAPPPPCPHLEVPDGTRVTAPLCFKTKCRAGAEAFLSVLCPLGAVVNGESVAKGAGRFGRAVNVVFDARCGVWGTGTVECRDPGVQDAPPECQHLKVPSYSAYPHISKEAYRDEESVCWEVQCDGSNQTTVVLQSLNLSLGDTLTVAGTEFTGAVLPAQNVVPAASPVRISFSSDAAYSGGGFRVKVMCEPPPMPCPSVLPWLPKDRALINYYNGYPANHEECWILKCPGSVGMATKLWEDLPKGDEVTFFDLRMPESEVCAGQGSCRFDQLLGVRFKSDASVFGRGFWMRIECTEFKVVSLALPLESEMPFLLSSSGHTEFACPKEARGRRWLRVRFVNFRVEGQRSTVAFNITLPGHPEEYRSTTPPPTHDLRFLGGAVRLYYDLHEDETINIVTSCEVECLQLDLREGGSESVEWAGGDEQVCWAGRCPSGTTGQFFFDTFLVRQGAPEQWVLEINDQRYYQGIPSPGRLSFSQDLHITAAPGHQVLLKGVATCLPTPTQVLFRVLFNVRRTPGDASDMEVLLRRLHVYILDNIEGMVGKARGCCAEVCTGGMRQSDRMDGDADCEGHITAVVEGSLDGMLHRLNRDSNGFATAVGTPYGVVLEQWFLSLLSSSATLRNISASETPAPILTPHFESYSNSSPSVLHIILAAATGAAASAALVLLCTRRHNSPKSGEGDCPSSGPYTCRDASVIGPAMVELEMESKGGEDKNGGAEQKQD